MKHLVLILLPGEQVRCECNKQKDGQQQKDGPGDLMGTFVLDDLPGCHLGFLFRLQFARNRRLTFLRLQSVCHGYKDKNVQNIRYL